MRAILFGVIFSSLFSMTSIVQADEPNPATILLKMLQHGTASSAGSLAAGAVRGESKEQLQQRAQDGFVSGAVSEGVNQLANYFMSGSTPGNGKALKDEIGQVAVVCPKYEYLLQRLSERVDNSVTRSEFEAQVRQLGATIAEMEAAEAKYRASIENRLNSQENRLNSQENRLNSQGSEIAYIQERQQELRRDLTIIRKHFEDSLQKLEREVRSEFADVRNELSKERRDRERELAYERSTREREIAALRKIVDPETRRQAASKLAASGSLILVHNDDPAEAKKLLQLALGYDRHVHSHADPGIQYMLAIAYKRTGESARAEELLSEAIVAERFRIVPGWYSRIMESFQGSDRIWIEAARQDYRFGVRAPREVVSTLDVKSQ